MKYIIDDTDKNKHEAMSKQEIIALLQQVIDEGEIPEELIDGVITKIRNTLDNKPYGIVFCTQAKYNELEANEELEENTYYFITDDVSVETLEQKIDEYFETIDSLEERVETLEQKKVTGQVTYNPTGEVLFNLIASHPTIRFYTYVEESTEVVQRFIFKQVNVNATQSITISTGTTSWSIAAYYADGTAVPTSGVTLLYEYFK